MGSAETVFVEFTAAPEYVAVARRVAEVIGARAGLAPVRLEELQIAVSEVCNRLVNAAHSDPGRGHSVRLRFRMDASAVIAEVGASGAALEQTLRLLLDEEFPLYLMRRLVDHVERVEGADGPELRLVKGRQAREEGGSSP
jgi:anti-sigma regulatory factor (Ser/Thr protein kinase)